MQRARREDELAAIDRYLECPGATMCPTRFALGGGTNALSRSEVARRLVLFTPRPPRRSTREENQRRWRELLHLSATAPDVDRSYQLYLTRMPVRLGR
jgi:hypothetical protein